MGRLDGEFPCRRVEGGRHGDDQILLTQRRLGMTLVPRIAQVAQIGDGSLERRNPLDLIRSLRWQQGRASVDPGMRQPTLGAGHKPDGCLAAKLPGQFADQGFRLVIPWQDDIARGQFGLMRLIEKRRQLFALPDHARGSQLRNIEHLQRRLIAVGFLQIDEGNDAIGGAQIDTDRVTRLAHSSTSAGARMPASWPSAKRGRWMRLARQPR